MREIYDKILESINKIDFEKLWTGFSKYDFALYSSKEVFFEDKTIPWDERFVGNTAIKFENKYIAIWNIEDDYANLWNDKTSNNNRDTSLANSIDTETLASNIIHEMFHAYQYKSKESRFPKDLVTLDYPDDIGNFCLKYEENKILAKAFKETDLSIKRSLFQKFYSIRIKRQEIIGEMCKCEYLLETTEGIAEFVGTMALKQLSEKKYLDRMKAYSKYLEEFSALQFDLRRISYYSGVVFLVIAHDLGINFEHKLSEQYKTIFEIITDGYESIDIDDLHLEKSLIEKAILENIEYKKDLIDKFMCSANRVSTSGYFFICGYDPMNMIKLNNKILCKHFILLKNKKADETLRFFGETLLEMKLNTTNEVICYYR